MRALRRTPVPPGAAGVAALIEPLQQALDGSGDAIAPVPVTTPTVSDDYVRRLLNAMKPDDADAPLESDDIAVVIATSGSTGDPAGVLHTATSLTSMTDAVNSTSSTSSTSSNNVQWIAALPLTSMGGFNVLVRALATGREPIALASIGGAVPFTPRDFANAVAQCTTDDIRVSLVAAQVRRLLADDEGTEALKACTQVLVGAGPTPATVQAAARELGINLTLTYGTTETAGGCVYDGVPLPGVGITIEHDAGHADPSQPGHVIISGPMLARGYRCDPQRTAERFTAQGFRTLDLGSLSMSSASGASSADDTHRVLTLQGRMDDVVIVNGVNVSLGAVERAIEEIPDVAAAAAIGSAANADTEREIIAVVIARDPSGHSELKARITATVERSLGRPAVPRRVAVVPEFPMLPNGKLDRTRLTDDAAKGKLTWLQ